MHLSTQLRNHYRKLCDDRFYWFVKLVGGYAGQGGIISDEIHAPLCDFWQDDSIKRKAIFMPRNWLKSTVFTQWGTLWRWLKDPNTRVLIISQNSLLAARFLHFIQQQILKNDLLRTLYADKFVYKDGKGDYRMIDAGWKRNNRWTSEYCDLPRTIDYKEASLTSIGVGGAAQSGHYPLAFMDDPVGKKHIDSITEMEKVFRYHDNLPELLENPNYMEPNASLLTIVCTFWGPGDYGSYVMKNFPEFHWRIVPCLKDEELEDTDTVKYVQNPTAEHMTSNWEGAPEGRSTTEYYLAMKANPQEQAKFWAQHMNNPERAEGLHKFLHAWLRFFTFEKLIDEFGTEHTWIQCWNDDDTRGERFLLSQIPLYGFIDPGGFAEIKMMKRSSRNAILIGGQPHNSIKKFIFYTWVGHLKAPSKFIDEVFKAHEMFRCKLWRIETIAAQKYIYKHIQEARKERKKHLPITPLPVSPRLGDKDIDIIGLLDPFYNGEIYIHRSMKAFIGEYDDFPHGMTKDLLDCAGKMNRYCWSPRKKSDTQDKWKQSYKEYRQQKRGASGVSGYGV